jgi:hypothetical protein
VKEQLPLATNEGVGEGATELCGWKKSAALCVLDVQRLGECLGEVGETAGTSRVQKCVLQLVGGNVMQGTYQLI